MPKEISQEYLKEILEYDPETGEFTWKKNPGNKAIKGSSAGNSGGSRGYTTIGIDYVLYYAHRLAWLYMTGSFPEGGLVVDHVNRVKDDNRWCNLRVVTSLENNLNTDAHEAYLAYLKDSKDAGTHNLTKERKVTKWTNSNDFSSLNAWMMKAMRTTEPVDGLLTGL